MLKFNWVKADPSAAPQRRSQPARKRLRDRAEHRLALRARLREVDVPEQFEVALAQRQVDREQVVLVVGQPFRAADRPFHRHALLRRREHLSDPHVRRALARDAHEPGPVHRRRQRLDTLKIARHRVAQRQRERLPGLDQVRLVGPQKRQPEPRRVEPHPERIRCEVEQRKLALPDVPAHQPAQLREHLQLQVEGLAQPPATPLRGGEQVGVAAAHRVLVLQQPVHARHPENLLAVLHALPRPPADHVGEILQAQRGEASHDHRRAAQPERRRAGGGGQGRVQIDRAVAAGRVRPQPDEEHLRRVAPGGVEVAVRARGVARQPGVFEQAVVHAQRQGPPAPTFGQRLETPRRRVEHRRQQVAAFERRGDDGPPLVPVHGFGHFAPADVPGGVGCRRRVGGVGPVEVVRVLDPKFEPVQGLAVAARRAAQHHARLRRAADQHEMPRRRVGDRAHDHADRQAHRRVGAVSGLERRQGKTVFQSAGQVFLGEGLHGG